MADETQTPKPGPVLHVKMDALHSNADGERYMMSQGPNPEDIQVQGDLSVALDDVFGKALSFSGPHQEVIVPSPQVEEPEEWDKQSFTLAIWVKAGPLKPGGTVVSRLSDPNSWALRATNRLEFTWNDGSDQWHHLIADHVLDHHSWVHVAVSIRPGDARLYVNGVLRDKKTDVGTLGLWSRGDFHGDVYVGENYDLSQTRSALKHKSSCSDFTIQRLNGETLLSMQSWSNYGSGGYGITVIDGQTFKGYAGQVAFDGLKLFGNFLNTGTYVWANSRYIWTSSLLCENLPAKFGDMLNRNYEKSKDAFIGSYRDIGGDLAAHAHGLRGVAYDGKGTLCAITKNTFSVLDQASGKQDDFVIDAWDNNFLAYDASIGYFLVQNGPTLDFRYVSGTQWSQLTDDQNTHFSLDIDGKLASLFTPSNPSPPPASAHQAVGFAYVKEDDEEIYCYGWPLDEHRRATGVPGRLTHPETGEEMVFGTDNLTCACFDDTGQYLAGGTKDGSVYLWDLYTGESISELGDDGPMISPHLHGNQSVESVAVTADPFMIYVHTGYDFYSWDADALSNTPDPYLGFASGLRLYDRAVAQDEIEEIALHDLPEISVGTVFPVDFNLHNAQNQQALYLTNDSQELRLEITNVGDSAVVFPSAADLAKPNNPTARRSVLQLRFRPGTLLPDEVDDNPDDAKKPIKVALEAFDPKERAKLGHADDTNDWQMARRKGEDGSDILELVHAGGVDDAGITARTLFSGKTSYLRITGLQIDKNRGVHVSRLQLSYRLQYHDGAPLLGTRLHQLRFLELQDAQLVANVKQLQDDTSDIDQIKGTGVANKELIDHIHDALVNINNADKALKGLEDSDYFEHGGPLVGGILGVPAVMNDGVTENHLTLRIQKRKTAVNAVTYTPQPQNRSEPDGHMIPPQITVYLFHPTKSGWTLLSQKEAAEAIPKILSPKSPWNITSGKGAPVVTLENPSAVKGGVFDHVDLHLKFICKPQTHVPAKDGPKDDPYNSDGDASVNDATGDGTGQRFLFIEFSGIAERHDKHNTPGWLVVPVERTRLVDNSQGATLSGVLNVMPDSRIAFHADIGPGGAQTSDLDGSTFLSGDRSLNFTAKKHLRLYPGRGPDDLGDHDNRRGMVLSAGEKIDHSDRDDAEGETGDVSTLTTNAYLDGKLTAAGGIDTGGASITTAGAAVSGDIVVYGNVKPGETAREPDPADITGSYLVPKGAIMMWSGEKLPHGWELCDGVDGRPNLQSHFVVGASGPVKATHPPDLTPYTVNKSTGGAEKVALKMEDMPNHDHEYGDGPVEVEHTHDILKISAGNHHRSDGNDWPVTTPDADKMTTQGENTGIHWPSVMTDQGGPKGAKPGESTAHENLPPYVALYYIIKM